MAAAACSSGDLPPLQAAVVASSTTADEPLTATTLPTPSVSDAAAAEPQTASTLPTGFEIENRRCYQLDTGDTLTTAVLWMNNEETNLVGGLEFGQLSGFSYSAVAGTRRGSSFSVNISPVESFENENEDWFFEPFGALLPGQVVLDIIDCEVVTEATIAIEAEISQFPDAP